MPTACRAPSRRCLAPQDDQHRWRLCRDVARPAAVESAGNAKWFERPDHSQPMRSCQCDPSCCASPTAWGTTPRHYGPWVQFASLLTEGLVAAGNNVTLFSPLQTRSLRPACTQRRSGAGLRRRQSTPRLQSACTSPRYSSAPTSSTSLPTGSISCRSHTSISSRHPVITTIHGFSSDRIMPVYKRYDSTTAYVSISDSDRHPDLHYAATIRHGIDLDDFAIDPSPGEDLLFFGRVNLQSVGRPDAAAIAPHRSPASPSPPRGTTSSSSGTSHSLCRPEIGPPLTSAKPSELADLEELGVTYDLLVVAPRSSCAFRPSNATVFLSRLEDAEPVT